MFCFSSEINPKQAFSLILVQLMSNAMTVENCLYAQCTTDHLMADL